MDITHSLARNPETNAALGWTTVAFVFLTAAVAVFGESLLGGVLALVAAVVLAVPAVLRRDWRAMVPWPLGLTVAAGVVTRALGVAPEVTGYVAISGLALTAVVELNAFTDVEMSRRFAVLLALMTTIAFQSWWTIAGYYSDRWLGTGFIGSQTELQWDLVAVTVVALATSGLFMWYFEHIEHVGSRHEPIVPEEDP